MTAIPLLINLYLIHLVTTLFPQINPFKCHVAALERVWCKRVCKRDRERVWCSNVFARPVLRKKNIIEGEAQRKEEPFY